MVALIGASFSLLYRDISLAIVSGIRAGLTSEAPASLGPVIVGEIAQIRTQSLFGIISIIVLITILFGYIIARITLSPVRNTLAAQKQFIGNIAHELRTPLSIIKTNTEVALLETAVAPGMKTTLESTVEELDRLSEIINNLLSLSTLVRPERIDFAAVDLSEIVSDAAQKFSQLAQRGGHQITLKKSSDCLVWGNPIGLQQVTSNLLKNALSYTPRGGHVRMTAESAPDGSVDLIVQDSGIGIARKDLFRIFEPFYRADPSRVRGAHGSGLGLAIVSELVKMHNGKITVRSAVGRGTTVTVRFPGVAGRGVIGKEVDTEHSQNEIAVDFSRR